MLMMCASSMYTKEIGNMNMDEYDGDNKYMIMATIGDNPMYSDQIPQAIVYDEKSLKSANKRSSSTYRLCGSRLIDAIKSVCGNCIKPIGFRPVEVKRGINNFLFFLLAFSICLIQPLNYTFEINQNNKI